MFTLFSKEVHIDSPPPLLQSLTVTKGHDELKGLIYKNLQNAAEGGMAPRQMIPTAVICYP